MKNRLLFFGFLLIISILYIGGCRRAGIWLVKEDVITHSDAMVLLMGGFPDRVLQAVDLYKEGKADRLLIVEESMGPFSTLEVRGADIISNTEQARNACISLGIRADSITILAGDARSTQDEAIVVRDYFAENGDTDTLLLVSSAPHMRRASMIFKDALKKSDHPVYIGCSPSAYSKFDASRWWSDKEGIQTVITEYMKMGSFVVFEKKSW